MTLLQEREEFLVSVFDYPAPTTRGRRLGLDNSDVGVHRNFSEPSQAHLSRGDDPGMG